jgi:hypothetical protein
MAGFQAGSPDGLAVQQLEQLLRAALFKPASQIVGYLLQDAANRIDAFYQPKPGEHYKGRQTLKVRCLFGTFSIRRDYYHEPDQEAGHHPADDALGLEGALTPALAKILCLEAVDETSFQKAQEHLAQTGGIEVETSQIQRWVGRVGQGAIDWQSRDAKPQACDAKVLYLSADGTGVPMRKKELAGRKGKQPDGSAKTRQAYLGCVFTQHTCDEKGHPIRDYQSTTYISSFDNIEDFGLLLRKEALRRGSGTAQKIVLLFDGAEGLEHMGKINFSGCQQIVDFYHAMQHLADVLEALTGQHPGKDDRQYKKWTKFLLKDGVQKIIDQAREMAAAKTCQSAVEKELHYFVHNTGRMLYGTYRKAGYFIGSGVIEAGCKSVIGARCKQSGMFWSESGAHKVLALRCIKCGNTWEAFWKERLNTRAALNDALPLAA